MLSKEITQSELDFVETLYHPRGFSEVMFSNGDNLALFEDNKFLNIQTGQVPLLAFDHLIDDDYKLSEKENLHRREMAGDILCLAARNTGKTFCGEELDIQQTLVVEENLPCIFTSFDAQHLKGVLDKSYDVCKRHPIISDFIANERAGGLIRSPYKFISRWGVVIDGINMKVSSGSQAGDGFFQKHVKRIWVEEKSRESQVVYDKRVDAVSIQGCVTRSLGMTDYVKNSPTGKEVEAPENRYKIMNFPQYVNADFDEKEMDRRIKKFGGKETHGFKIYVGGEVVASGDSVLDMRIIRDLCIAKGTKILMADFSTKNIEDVKIGDEIFTFEEFPEKSNLRKFVKSTVTNTMNNGKKEVFDFKIGKNILTSTFDHLLLGTINKLSSANLWFNAMGFAQRNGEVYSLDGVIYDQKKFLEGCLIGFNDSDGIHKVQHAYQICQKTEKEVLEWILKELKIEYTKYKTKVTDCYEYYLKSENKEYIDCIYADLESDKDIQLGYLVGMVLGDGSNSEAGFTISQKDGEICERIKKISKLLDIDLKVYPVRTREKMNQMCLPIWSLLPSVQHSKKVEKFKNRLLKKGTILTVGRKKIELLGNKRIEEVYDLTTTAHTFIANGVLVHNCYPKDFVDEHGRVDESKCIKQFELSQKNYSLYKTLLVLSRPTNANSIYVCADIGQEGGITEITIYSEIINPSTGLKTYRLLYNITLNQMPKPQQYAVFSYITQLIKPDYISLDSTGGMGEAIYSDMQVDPIFKDVTLVWVAFNENIEIGLEYEKNGNGDLVPKRDNSGKTIKQFLRTDIWSVQRASHLLYNALVYLPFSAKLDEQLDKLVAVQGTNGIRYVCIAEENHLWQSFQTFCVAQWRVEYEKIGKKNKCQKVACKL